MRKPLILGSLFFALAMPLAAEPLVVATKEAPPFSFQEAGEWKGLSIELWEEAARELGVEYRFEAATLNGIFKGLENGRFDAAVAALTVTPEREERVDFSHPIYRSGLGIAVSTSARQGYLSLVKSFFSLNFLKAVLGLAAVLLVLGVLVWLFERRVNPEEFGGTTIQGLGHGFWWAAVTMTTVGYGDKSPRSKGGRVVALVWMFASLVLLGAFIAAFSSAVTINQLSPVVAGEDDLPDARVGVVSATTGEILAQENGYRFKTFDTVDAALDALAESEIDAVVYDRPILRHALRQREDPDLTTLDVDLTEETYAIALPSGSELREQLNRSLLRQLTGPRRGELLGRYLGE